MNLLAILICFSTVLALNEQCISDHMLRDLADKMDMPRLMETLDTHLLIPRVSGTANNDRVRQFLLQKFEIELGWHTELDLVADVTPEGKVEFGNVVAYADRRQERYLTLAAHFDSKMFPVDPVTGKQFLGATDSAVSCAMLIEIARIVGNYSSHAKSLQLVFFDGEEAVHEWTAQDSLYGSRHLAEQWQSQPALDQQFTGNLQKSRNRLDQIDLMVLLDLLGSSVPWPTLRDSLHESHTEFNQLIRIESRLRKLGLLSKPAWKKRYFIPKHKDPYFSGRQLPFLDDDHQPFVARGVKAVHAIPVPFPRVWHTLGDDRKALDSLVIQDLTLIFLAFAVEYTL